MGLGTKRETTVSNSDQPTFSKEHFSLGTRESLEQTFKPYNFQTRFSLVENSASYACLLCWAIGELNPKFTSEKGEKEPQGFEGGCA